MGRAPFCDRATWSPDEDSKLEFNEKHGTGGNWIALPLKAGLRRCGKRCRLRLLNYLRSNLKNGEFSDDEDRIICTLCKLWKQVGELIVRCSSQFQVNFASK